MNILKTIIPIIFISLFIVGCKSEKNLSEIDEKIAIQEIDLENTDAVNTVDEEGTDTVIAIEEELNENSQDDYYKEDFENAKEYLHYREEIKDYNRDGVLDTLSYYDDTGSGGHGFVVRIVNGKNHKSYYTDTSRLYNARYNIIYLDDELLDKKNKGFYQVLKRIAIQLGYFDDAFYEEAKHVSCSLDWLLKANLQLKRLEGNEYFVFYITSVLLLNLLL